MNNKDLENKIKKVKEFMELWVKFHDLYKTASKKETIEPEEERTFLETKSLIARKYQALIDFLGIAPSLDDKTFDVISQVLSLQGVSSLSDVQLEEVENEWHHSYIFLNKLLGGLESRKEVLARINPLSVLISKLFSAIGKLLTKKAIKTAFILVILYLVLVKGLHMDEKLRGFLAGFPPLQGLFSSQPDAEE